jgi:hypothetical protein
MPGCAAQKRNTDPAPSRRPALSMHAGQCTICRHPRRAEIERAFLDCRGAQEIARDHGLGSHSTVYRHAHALGLFERRSRTLWLALGRLIEQAGNRKLTVASIASAICLTAKPYTREKRVEEMRISATHPSTGFRCGPVMVCGPQLRSR